ncbi:hypothetical protein ETD86_05955 [Nonomuraea turkmeniaca]|uniref:Secreted protein n=1 Tax=Nonomuraea turkmeniaca TaxID=103838 RepID=A0A5S4FTH5_9ACTN|nr:hypothetical protein [Nonomuraea turkmeniaca]TMR24065.1 hypothetical protein ETD86_05955 [Nonomuraea turkmeniaca]
MSLRTSLAVLTVAGAASLGLAAAPAQAATLGNVPGCVSVWSANGKVTKTGYAYNGCTYRVRMRIVWAWAPDGACTTVNPGRQIWSQKARGHRFDGAKTC